MDWKLRSALLKGVSPEIAPRKPDNDKERAKLERGGPDHGPRYGCSPYIAGTSDFRIDPFDARNVKHWCFEASHSCNPKNELLGLRFNKSFREPDGIRTILTHRLAIRENGPILVHRIGIPNLYANIHEMKVSVFGQHRCPAVQNQIESFMPAPKHESVAFIPYPG